MAKSLTSAMGYSREARAKSECTQSTSRLRAPTSKSARCIKKPPFPANSKTRRGAAMAITDAMRELRLPYFVPWRPNLFHKFPAEP